MKTTIYGYATVIALLFALAWVASCSPEEKKEETHRVIEDTSEEIRIGTAGGGLRYMTVTIEGKEYLAFKSTHGYWGLCPK